jgi:hypothetical protein
MIMNMHCRSLLSLLRFVVILDDLLGSKMVKKEMNKNDNYNIFERTPTSLTARSLTSARSLSD